MDLFMVLALTGIMFGSMSALYIVFWFAMYRLTGGKKSIFEYLKEV